jgi:DnaK suppressor protein
MLNSIDSCEQILRREEKRLEKSLKEKLEDLSFDKNELNELSTHYNEESKFFNKISISRAEVKQLKNIKSAILKLSFGGFGICESCGETIDFKRLRASPSCRCCIRCQEYKEKIN